MRHYSPILLLYQCWILLLCPLIFALYIWVILHQIQYIVTVAMSTWIESFFISYYSLCFEVSSVQFSRSVMSNSLQWTGLPVHLQLLEFTQTHVHWIRGHLILCCPLLRPPSIFPSIRVFSNESVLRIRWPKDWSFSFNISPSKEHPGVISFMMDWLDILAVHVALKSLLQHHNSKASILQRSAFFIVSWTARRANQSILKEISPEYSLKGLMLKLKLQYFGHLMWRIDSLEKTLMLGKIDGRRRAQQRMRWVDGITDLMDVSLIKL